MSVERKTPRRRFKEFQNAEAWEQRKLSEVAEFNPKSELPDEFEYVDLESVVGTKMISHRTETKASAPSRAQRLARTGDVFYQIVRPYQKNNYLFSKLDKNYVFSTGYAQMRPNIDTSFLMSFLQTDNFVKVVLDNCTGTSYPSINSTDLSNLDILLPVSKDEQEKIGRYISNLDNLITLNQNKLEKLKALKKAYLAQMFPAEGERKPKLRFAGFTDEWEQFKLIDEINYIGTGKSKFDTEKKNSQKDKYPVLGSTSIIGYESDYDYSGDFILTARVGANAGELYRYSGKVKISDNTVFIKGTNLDYIYYSLVKYNLKNLSFGTGQPLIKASELSKLLLLLTNDEKERKKIGEFLLKMDKLITLYQRKLEKLQNLKKAYLNEMFV